MVSTIKEIIEPTSEFPDITLCELDPLTKPDSIQLFNTIPFSFIPSNTTDKIGPISDYVDKTSDSIFTYSSLLTNLDDSVLNNYRNLINESFLVCQYNMNACNNNEIEFRYVFLEFLGFCIRITTNPKLTKAGIFNGLVLQMVIDPPNKQNRFVSNRGIRVFIHNKSIGANFNVGVDISTGKSYNIEVKRTFNNQLPAPYSDCLLDTSESKGVKLVHQFNQSYTQK